MISVYIRTKIQEDKPMSVKFLGYQISKYGNFDGYSGFLVDRVYDDERDEELIGEPFWILDGILPSETFELLEVCKGTFEDVTEMYRLITGHDVKLVEPTIATEYVLENLPV